MKKSEFTEQQIAFAPRPAETGAKVSLGRGPRFGGSKSESQGSRSSSDIRHPTTGARRVIISNDATEFQKKD